MMNSKDLAIGILSTTAVILLASILVIHSQPAPAMASGMAATAGDYVMTVGTYTINDEELVFVVHAPSEKLIIYRFNPGKGQIDIADGIELDQMRAAATGTAQPGSKGSRGSRRP